jgi:polyisoprenoid-binding protein YceI
MTKRFWLHTFAPCAAVTAIWVASAALAGAQSPLGLDSARITISGTSNIHAYTASTSTIRVTRAEVAAVAGPDFWLNALKAGAVEALDVAIPAATLTSPREGLDKNMHKALKVQEHADITFRLVRLEAGEGGAVKAIGALRIAGVEREIALDLKTQRAGATLTVKGETQAADDGLRHQAADGDARDAEDGSQSDRRLRDDSPYSPDVASATGNRLREL